MHQWPDPDRRVTVALSPVLVRFGSATGVPSRVPNSFSTMGTQILSVAAQGAEGLVLAGRFRNPVQSASKSHSSLGTRMASANPT